MPQQASGTGSGSKEKENTFSYQQFPALSPALYGPIRPARVLLQKPEKGRQLSQSSKALQETIEMRTRTLGRTDSCKSLADSAAKKLALKERMASAKIQNIRSLRSIVAVQSCFRMMGPRRAFLEKLSVRSIFVCGVLHAVYSSGLWGVVWCGVSYTNICHPSLQVPMIFSYVLPRPHGRCRKCTGST